MKKLAYSLLLFAFIFLLPNLSCVKEGESQQNSITPEIEREGDKKYYRIPELKPDEVWISSLPIGLDVGKFRVSESDLRRFGLQVLPFNPVAAVAPVNHIGTTPLTISLEPGRYFISIAIPDSLVSVLFDSSSNLILDKQLGISEFSTPTFTIKPYSEDVQTGRYAIVYGIVKEHEQSAIILSLFQPFDVPLQDLYNYYPSGNNFAFSDNSLKAALEKAIDQEQLDKIEIEKVLELLHRGGKIFLSKEKSKGWIIQITGHNTWEIRRQIIRKN